MAATDYNWPVSAASVTATNPSVSTNGAVVPASSTQVGGSDGTNLQAIAVTAAGVVKTVAQAGTAVMGKVSIDQTTPGTTNLVALAANQSVNVAQINGVTPLMGNGVTGTGAQRVTIASDNTAFAVNATLQAGAAVVGKVSIDQTTPGTTNLVALAANQSVNVAQMNGVATTMGNGVAGTGVQRVAIASDNTAFSVNAVQSGTWTVQPGNTANTTAWLVDQVKAASSAVTSVAGSATTVSLLASNTSRKNATFFNDSTALLYLKLGATASTTSYTVQIPAGGYYELPPGRIYTGAIDGIWAAANGNARITELS